VLRALLLQELQREYPGPVTAVESLRGFLLMAIGNKLEMHYKQVGGSSMSACTLVPALQLAHIPYSTYTPSTCIGVHAENVAATPVAFKF
jgi:hypothetical protein